MEEARKLAEKEQEFLASPDRSNDPDFSPVVTASREAHKYLADWIVETKHRALLPVALRMLESKSPHYPVYQLLSFVYQFPESADKVHPRLVKLVKDGLWEDDLTVFEYWRIHGTKIPSASWPTCWGRTTTGRMSSPTRPSPSAVTGAGLMGC